MRKITARAIQFTAVAFIVLPVDASPTPSPLPPNYEQMEIEAKWTLSPGQFELLKEQLSGWAEGLGWQTEIRWNGDSRKFVDVYFDDRSETLSEAGHSLRHRTQWKKVDRASDAERLNELDSTNWERNWERVQYKSTPCRIEEVWFRVEQGACRIWDEGDADSNCSVGEQQTAPSVIYGTSGDHPAIDLLSKDHHGYELASVIPRSIVVDYRYRLIFKEGGEDLFEVSLDRLRTVNVDTGLSVSTAEAELEIIADGFDEATVRKLLQTAEKMRKEFRLTPSVLSKGGVPVKQCSSATI